jgi:drug/metabolite transporter (DMT)-like permease
VNAKLKIIATMITFSTLGPFIKNINLVSSEIALYRAVIALIILTVFIIFNKNSSKIDGIKNNLWKLFFSGAAMGFNWILLFAAFNYTSIALATLCYYFAPVIVVIGSTFLFQEKLTLKQIACFIGSTAGLVLIIGVSSGGTKDMIGILLGLGAAILYATVILLNKSMKDIDGITRTIFQLAAAVVVLFPYVFGTGGFHIQELNSLGLINLLTVGIVHTGIVYVLYFSSLSELTGQEASVLSYLDPLFAILISILWLGESITQTQLLGGGMILLFTLANEMKIYKKYSLKAK